MATKKKLLQAAAGSAGGGPLNIEDVFNSYTYEGHNTDDVDVVNGIDLSGEGGAVLIKNRDVARDFYWVDTQRNKRLRTNTSGGESASSLITFNSDGYTVGNGDQDVNDSNNNMYLAWSFRKSPGFFDLQEYTGTGSTVNVSHNLGMSPGMIWVKRTDSSGNWYVGHIGSNGQYWASEELYLNDVDSGQTNSVFSGPVPWGSSSVNFTGNLSLSGATYVAYFFADHDGDGEFGPDGDLDIAKCGHFTTPSSAQDFDVTLGWEPQFVFFKLQSAGGWLCFDSTTGLHWQDSSQPTFYLNQNWHETQVSSNNFINPTPTGFQITQNAINQSLGTSQDVIFYAVRRGPTADVEDADDVFAIDNKTGTSDQFYAPWPADFALIKYNVDDIGTVTPWQWTTRDMNDFYLSSNNNSNQSSNNYGWDTSRGLDSRDTINDPSDYAWMWRRKEGFCDSIIYIGDRFASGGNTVNHGLGVVPEMIICKSLEDTGNWAMYHSALGNTKAIEINNGTAAQTSSGFWNNTSPTSTTFTLGTNSHTNGTGFRHLGLLFASIPGVCKVGSYTGTGSDQNIDCGFSNGAKLVMLKNADQNEEFLFFDSERGIISGNSPYLQLGSNAYQFSSQNYLSPYSAGFTVPGSATNNNSSGDTFIYYAIAAP